MNLKLSLKQFCTQGMQFSDSINKTGLQNYV